jgi:hypothetical protein
MAEGKAIEIEGKTDEWYAECGRFPQSGDSFTSASGMPIKGLHTRVDIAPTRYWEGMGFSGEYLLTPGVRHTESRGQQR